MLTIRFSIVNWQFWHGPHISFVWISLICPLTALIVDMMCPQFWHGYLSFHLPPTYIQIGFHCGLSADNPSCLGTIYRDFWRDDRMCRCRRIYRGWCICRAGWICIGGRTCRVRGHAELEGASADVAPCEEEEANDSSTGPKELIGVFVTTWIISAKPSSCFTFPSLCCWSPSLILFNPFNTDFLTPSSIFSVPSPNPIWYSASCHSWNSSSTTKPTSPSSFACKSTPGYKKTATCILQATIKSILYY